MASSTRTATEGEGNDWTSDLLADQYFHWLGEHVKEDGKERSYWDLLRIMHDTEFVWLVANDDNRIADGLDLRVEFFRNWGLDPQHIHILGPCSILEVVVGISRRIAWVADGSAEGWAWQLLCNLELHKFRDPLSRRKRMKVDEILHRLVWRTYDPDGTGGFFPLAWPKEDQRQVEIWYQMSAYVEEIHPEY